MTTENAKLLKLIRYSFQLKANSISGILITCIGILMLGISTFGFHASSAIFLLGAFYVVLGPTIIVQMLLLTLYANMVKASPKARRIELNLADILSAIIGISGYTIIILFCVITNHIKGDIYPPSYLLITGILIAILLIYNSIAYKLFISGIIGLSIAVALIFAAFVIVTETTLFGTFSLGTGICCLLGYLIVFISIGLSHVLRKGVYKIPFSKLAAGSKLRKEL